METRIHCKLHVKRPFFPTNYISCNKHVEISQRMRFYDSIVVNRLANEIFFLYSFIGLRARLRRKNHTTYFTSFPEYIYIISFFIRLIRFHFVYFVFLVDLFLPNAMLNIARKQIDSPDQIFIIEIIAVF